MEKDSKVVLFGVAILLLAMISVSFNDLQGNKISGNVVSPSVRNPLILHYDFEQTPIKDKSSYANDVTNQYGGSIVQGKIGNGIYFGNFFGNLEVVNSQSLDITGNKITMMAWVKMENLGSTYPLYLAKKKIDDRSTKYALFVNLQGINNMFTTTSGSLSGNQIPININTWYHTAVIYNGDTSEVITYLNGQEVQRIGLTGNFQGSNSIFAHFVVGQDSISGPYKTVQDYEISKGTIDELKIYNAALSAQEILNEFNYNGSIQTTTTNGTIVITNFTNGTINNGSITQLICNGCLVSNRCIPIGFRTRIAQVDLSSKSFYCEVSKQLIQQKIDALDCDNNYECKSNVCSENKCVNLGQQLVKTRSLLAEIYCRLSNPLSQTNYQICLQQRA